MELVRPMHCKRLDWRSVFYATQATEVVLVCVGILTTHWLEGRIVPVPWIRVQMDIGLLETCLSWQDYTACAKDGEVLQMMANALGKKLDYIQQHTFDIPTSFLYVVTAMHFLTVAILFSDHPLGLPRCLNIIQLIFLVISLCWFGLSSFKQDMCDYLEGCSFGWSLYLVLVATLLNFFRLIYHFYRFRRDGEDSTSLDLGKPQDDLELEETFVADPRVKRSQSHDALYTLLRPPEAASLSRLGGIPRPRGGAIEMVERRQASQQVPGYLALDEG